MAKIGMDSFLLDCHTNDNISEIEAEYGVKGFAVVVRLWQKIYSEKGYYCEWVERSPLLFLSNWFGGNSGVTINLITDVVKRCLKNGIFNAEMYENYSILTSARIQKQYFDVVKRREEILVKKEYLLISVDKIKGIVYENEISVCRIEKNVCRIDTSKVKESKVKKSKEKKIEPLKLFEEFWMVYPRKASKMLAEQAYIEILSTTSNLEEFQLLEAAKNYAEYCEISAKEEIYIKYASNWLKDLIWMDFLSENYKKPQKGGSTSRNTFNNIENRKYNMGELEQRLLGH